MRFRVHINSPIGDYKVFNAYELDAAVLLAMEGATQHIAPTTAHTFHIHKWTVQNNNIYSGIAANIPRKPEEDGNIFPTRHAYNYNLGGYKYLEDWFDSDAWEKVTERPDNWGTTTEYYRVWGGSRPSGFRIVWPYVYGASPSDFESDNTYRDKLNHTSVIFYTDTGTRFSISKSSAYAAAGVVDTQGWFIGYRPSNSNAVEYQICTSGGVALHSDLHFYYQPARYDTNIITNSLNIIQCGVHYTYQNQEYYGFAHIYFQSYADDAIPTKIEVIGISPDFFGTSIIPGGGGSGSWGSNTTNGGANGTWTFPSNSRGDGTAAAAEAIATARRTALQAFFTASHGYQLHQILPNEIQNIFGVLYGNTFISRYTTSIYNPLSAVISLHMLPQRLCDPLETSSPLTLSGFDVSAALPTPQNFPEISTIHSEHIGTIDIDATDTFLDYAPYTRAYLHLPYIGVLEIDINAIAAGSLGVDYITDAMTGNCAAYVWCSDRDGVCTFKYCATGNCSYSLPMFAAQQDGAALGKIVNSSLGVAMAAITGNAHAAIASVGGIAGGIFDAATTQRNTQISGSFGGNPGLITDTVCWLEIVRPVWCNPEYYKMLDGVPSMLSGTIQSFNEYGDGYEGFLKVSDLDTEGVQATDDELTEIETVLKSGIFVNAK